MDNSSMTDKQFSLYMAVTQCKGIPALSSQNIIDMAEKFYNYLVEFKEPDIPEKAPESPPAKTGGKKGK